MADATTPPDRPPQTKHVAVADQLPRPRRRGLYRLGWVLIVLAIGLALYGGAGLAGLVNGLAQARATAAAELSLELTRQMELAERDLADGRYALAERRLAWILANEPNFPGAADLAADVQAAHTRATTPSRQATPSRTPTPTATRSPEPLPDPAPILADLITLRDDGDWAMLILALQDFQATYPEYERSETDRLLFEAYVTYGRQLATGAQVEKGLFYLAQAESLGDLPLELVDLRSHAELYLQGRAFFGVDWGVAVLYFRDLCLVAPFYQNSCGKLYEALITYADLFATAQDWCPAQALYQEARQIDSDNALLARLATAVEQCAQATPTPTATTPATPTAAGETPLDATPTPQP